MTNAPADKTAKRLSAAEWFARYDAVELLNPRAEPRGSAKQRMSPPADRIAIRA